MAGEETYLALHYDLTMHKRMIHTMVGEGANFRGSKFPGVANGDVPGIESFLIGRHGVYGVTNVLEDDVLAQVAVKRIARRWYT
jgi:hypothetical protein